MPKPQYTQQFRDSWLQDPHLKDWLQVIESTAGKVPKCKFCGTTLRSHYGDLKSHGMSKKHQQNKKVNDLVYLYYSFVDQMRNQTINSESEECEVCFNFLLLSGFSFYNLIYSL